MKFRNKLIISTLSILLIMVSVGLAQQASSLEITTRSSTEYMNAPDAAIYPAFVDNIPYQSWTESGPSPYFQMAVRGGVKPYRWQVVKGGLPPGLKMDTNGRVSGMASKEGSYSFVVKVTDSKGASVSKSLIQKAEPFRSKWFSDAKFGIFVSWGAYTHPPLKGKDGVAEFEKRITKFNADAWAQAVVDMGGKVLTVNVKAGDGVRLWPSVTPSKLDLKTKRNLVKELVVACHKKGIKFIAYFAPDSGWNKDFVETGLDNTYGTLNLGLIKELIALGVDGFWIDMTSATELYQGFDPKWFPWDKMIPLMRANNPYVIFANNPGLGFGGTVLQYPNTDVLIYEGGTSPHETALEVAKPATVKKRLAIEVDNLLDNTWSWRDDEKLRAPKPVEMIINNIKKNWQVGATYMLSYPVPPDGNILPDFYKDRLNKIAAFVKSNQGWSAIPQPSLSDTIEYAKPQRLTLTAPQKAKIYYTLDGSRPTEKSRVYSGPIVIQTTTRVSAISKEPGRPTSKLMDKSFLIAPQAKQSPSARASAIRASSATNVKTDRMLHYRGMRITVGGNPISINQIGRKYADGNRNKHSILIKRYADDYPLFSSFIDTKNLPLDDDGYQYLKIPPLSLEAGKTYLIAIQEDGLDGFVPDDFKGPSTNKDYRVEGYTILSSHGNKRPIVDDNLGQVISLKYSVSSSRNAGGNIALGKQAFLRNNKDQALGPANEIFFAENAIDGDTSTMGQAGGEYAWTLLIDLQSVVTNIRNAKIKFGKTAFSTEFLVLSSSDNKTWSTLSHVKDNNGLEQNLKFDPVAARYIKIRSLKPDGRGQKGGSMGILEFELYR